MSLKEISVRNNLKIFTLDINDFHAFSSNCVLFDLAIESSTLKISSYRFFLAKYGIDSWVRLNTTELNWVVS